MDLAQYLIPAAAGLVSGVIGSLIAPWVQWGIESRRDRKVARKDLLAEVRTLLAEPPSLADFRRLPIYSRILPLVSESTREVLTGKFDERGNETIVLVMGGAHGGINPFAHKVLTDLAAKEKEWGLV
jgi:hypothetical protein